MKLRSLMERHFDILFKYKLILLIINSYKWTTVSSTLRIPSVLPVVSEEFVKLTITTSTSLGARYKRSNPPNSSIGQGNQSKNVTSGPPDNSVGLSNNTGSPSLGMHNRQGTHIHNLQGTPEMNNMNAASNTPSDSGSPVVPSGSETSSVPRGRIGSYLLPNELRISFTLGNEAVHLDLLKNRQFGRNAVPVFTKLSDGSIVQHGLSSVKHVGSYYTDKDHTHNLHLECMSNSSSTCTHYRMFGSFEHNSDMHLIEPKVQPIDLGDECEHLHRIVKTDHIDGIKIDHLTLTGVKNSPAPTSLPAKKNNAEPTIDMIPSNTSNSMPMNNASTPTHENHSAPATIISTPANNNNSAAPTNITKISTNNEHRTPLAITSLPTHKAMAPKQANHPDPNKITSIPSKKKRPVSKTKSLPVTNKIPTPKKITSIPAKTKSRTPKNTSPENDKKKRPALKIKPMPMIKKNRTPKTITSKLLKKKPSPHKNTSGHIKKKSQAPKLRSTRIRKKHPTLKNITSIPPKTKHRTPKKIQSSLTKKKRPAPKSKSIGVKNKIPTPTTITSIPAKKKHSDPKKIRPEQDEKKRPASNIKSIRTKKPHPTPEKITSVPAKKKRPVHTIKSITANNKQGTRMKVSSLPEKVTHTSIKKIKSKRAKKNRQVSKIKSMTAKKKHPTPKTITSIPAKKNQSTPKKTTSVQPTEKSQATKVITSKERDNPSSDEIIQIPVQKSSPSDRMTSIPEKRRPSKIPSKTTKGLNRKLTSKLKADKSKTISSPKLSTRKHRRRKSRKIKGPRRNKRLKNKRIFAKNMATMFKRPRSPRRKNQKTLKKQRPHNSVFTIHRKRNKHQFNKISDRSTKDRSLAADLPIKSSFQQKENKTVVTTGTKKQHSDSKDQEETRKKQKNAITHMLNESDTFHENDKKLKNQEIQSHQMLNEPKPSIQHKTLQPEQLDKSSSKPWASIPGLKIPIDDIVLPFGQSKHRRKRATGNYNVEVFVVIDFPIYNFWLREENSNSDRAMQRVREYYTFLLLGVDNRFKKMNASYRVAVNLVGIYVAKRSSDLSFIQNHLSGGILNADTALSAMKQWVQTNGIPRHDHIMAFTRYDMRSGSFDTSGTAYLNSICTTRSNSIVEEKFDFIAATVAAHEIGHALGAVHDGENNRCSSSSGFIMVSVSQAMRPPNQKSPWEFSSCTSSEIGLYLDELNKKGSHCMQRTHPNAKNFNPGSQKRLGQTFDVDKQCEFIIGKGSYACRSFIGNSENVCTGVWCKTLDMTSTRCILGLPAEGTTCGSNKWCIGSSCVFDSRAPSRRRADCVFGDSPGLVLRGKTCTNLLRTEPFQCYSDSIKKNCCVSCEKVKTGIPNCDYGDKSTDCQRAKSLGQCSRFRSVCCQTCRNS
ncbi:uncharacterized protein [Mytilus edulis]|uniref:uncharacterized protein isoform X2 n=1 Tax=Mytilus edulis TaxID=6550 RepID=UPI0039EEC590